MHPITQKVYIEIATDNSTAIIVLHQNLNNSQRIKKFVGNTFRLERYKIAQPLYGLPTKTSELSSPDTPVYRKSLSISTTSYC